MSQPPELPRRSHHRPSDLSINTAPGGLAKQADTLLLTTSSTGKQTASNKNKPPVSNRYYKSGPSSVVPRSRDSDESFLDAETPVDVNKENEPFYRRPGPQNLRDSHDLSLPAEQFTRDSLVGNMLSSLDQFSLGQIQTPTRGLFDEADRYGSLQRDDYTRTMGSSTSRPHISNFPSHSYSYSSDLEAGDDHTMGQFSRGRRSDSGSTFHMPAIRLNSLRERSNPGGPSQRVLHSRGGKTSKSSSSNSIDAGCAQMSTSQRWAFGIRGRASSFDSGHQRSPLRSQAHAAAGWNADSSNTFLVDDYEAAPTPNVPGGPRRPALPIAPIVTPQAPPPPESDSKTSDRDRRKGTRSRSGTAKSNTSRAASSSRHGASHQQAMPAPPVPPIELDSAPAPHVGYEKFKDAVPPATAAAAPAKEKRGFFSRVFGTSRTPSATIDVQTATVPQTPPSDNLDRIDSDRSQQSAAANAQSAPPSRDSHHPQPTHVIQKKSSFFRRRKRSFNEPPLPTPPVPANIDTTPTKYKGIALPQPSPVSSLRQVMNQYLDDEAPHGDMPPHAFRPDSEFYDDDARRRVRGFSPDYEPDASATIRTVKSHSALKTRHSMVSLGRKASGSKLDTPNRVPPEVPRKPSTDKNRDETFFNDSSDDGEFTVEKSQRRLSRQQASKTLQRTTTDPEVARAELTSRSALQNRIIVNEPSLRGSLNLPMEGAVLPRRPSTSADVFPRSISSVPSLKIDSAQPSPKITSGDPLDEPEVTMGEPTEDDRQKAQAIYDGLEDFISKEKAAAWMGEEGLLRQRTLRAYMDLYSFENMSVLGGLREICGRLVLRGETQQVDRILVAFSQRWCECNPNNGFKSQDVIHTMCYSIMLLNTDLHLADIEHKMTRSQFIKNTMTTIIQAALDSAPDAFDRRSVVPGRDGLLIPYDSDTRPSTDQPIKQNWRSSFLPPRSESQMGSYGDAGGDVDGCGPLVRTPFEGPMKAWEMQMEIVLKDIYASIRDERLPLFGAEQLHTPQSQSQSTLSVMSMLKRSPSVLSKAPSESQASMRGRINDPKYNTTGRFSSKSRSRPRLPNGMSSSRTSFEDGNSIWSPAMSSATWSRYSLGRTQTSVSMGSFDTGHGGEYHQSIGFANALSQAIIREDFPIGASSQSVLSDETGGAQLLEDETLELCGAPWMKEGMVTHKHHLDAVHKKAKERNWSEVFAVIQKGTMSLFSFSTKSMRQKNRKGGKQAGAVVGGGNWQDNATSVGSFSLRQTLATQLPSPGYSPARPHVWALSLPTGAVHLFQVGTPEIGREFVVTVNYWSARLSTHPLVGGISNVEYGWSDAIINTALITDVAEASMPPRPGSAAAVRTSMHSRQNSRQSSLRSSFDVSSSSRTKLPGDKVTIAEWTPPAQSMRSSNSGEAEQLDTLVTYVKSIEEDLQRHNQMRSPMLLTFTPRGHNSARAMANWERKSSYLLREIVKFRTYVDGLQQAQRRRAEIYAERENARRAARGEDLSDSEDEDESDFNDDYDRDADEGDTTIRPDITFRAA
ncbi:PH and SEC7 domain-containing protein [Microdochium nivale]|nr:PH and SEC7 domain-containing protein [Microdochium nivale]